MEKDKEPQFTPNEEEKIVCVVESLIAEGERAVDRLIIKRNSHISLKEAVLQEGLSTQDSYAVGGRTVEMADEAIRRVQERIRKAVKNSQ